MTRDEMKEIMMKIDALYPNWKPENLTIMVDSWTVVLKDYPKHVIDAAVDAFIVTSNSKFPPSVSEILGIVKAAKQKPLDTMTPLEGWSFVYKAICNSNYHADEEFAKLPEICQKAVGSADNLREMAQMPVDTVNSVEQSHFIRAFQNLQNMQDEYEKIPAKVREVIGSESQKMLEG